ncbi:MAG: hypothetical protein RIT27_446 [Pseudomonadota bacterium]|jgi:hypothetical protein
MAGKAFFLIRINDHVQYLKKINRTLDGQDTFQGCSHSECKLGKWIYGEGESEVAALNNPRAIELFEALKEPHLQFHNMSQLALEKNLAGDKIGAQQAITEMHKLSTIVYNRLLDLDKIA